MKNNVLKTAGFFTLILAFLVSFAATNKKPTNTLQKSLSIYDFKLKTLDGKEITLAKFKGKKCY